MRRREAISLACLSVFATAIGVSPGVAEAEPGQWDLTLPLRVSAAASGDPVAIANASLRATRIATETTIDLGRKFLGSLGIWDISSPSACAVHAGRVRGAQAIEYVIRRAGGQIGVPYSWVSPARRMGPPSCQSMDHPSDDELEHISMAWRTTSRHATRAKRCPSTERSVEHSAYGR